MPSSLVTTCGASVAVLGRDVPLEHVGRLDHVVVDAHQDHVVDTHGSPPCLTTVWHSQRRSAHQWARLPAMDLGAVQDLMETTYGERDRARGLPAGVAWLSRGGR